MLKFVNQEASTDVYVYGDIAMDGEISASSFMEKISKAEQVRVHINSAGGDVFEAITIANALREHKGEVLISVEGLCASAATLLCCSGRKVIAAQNSLFMLHSPAVMLEGQYDVSALEKMQASLEKVQQTIEKMYEKRLKEAVDLSEEIWWDAEEAKSKGLVDEIVGEVELRIDESQQMIFVNKMAFRMSLPSQKVAEERRKGLAGLKGGELENALIAVALKYGHEVEAAKEYIAAAKGISQMAELKATVADNMRSGSLGVRGQASLSKAQERQGYLDNLVKFANRMI